VPGIAVRTTFITGFPGETEEDFEELLRLLRTSNSIASACSPIQTKKERRRYDLPNKVDPKIAKQRRAR
jgi:ribosomal protein S12 methylthiotransferase